MPFSVTANHLLEKLGTRQWPLVVCATRHEKLATDRRRIVASVWRDHMKTADWGPELARRNQTLVVHCLHGHNVSQLAVASLRAAGIDAAFLEGGIDAWEKAGGPVLTQHGPQLPFTLTEPSSWVTHRRPGVDRIACAWLVRRFIDPMARFHFVEEEWVRAIAEEMNAIPLDVAGVHYSRHGEGCCFDTLLDAFGLDNATLQRLAHIVRGADTAHPDPEPQSAGLLAMSLGLSAILDDDLEQLEQGMIICDALYAWCSRIEGKAYDQPMALQS